MVKPPEFNLINSTFCVGLRNFSDKKASQSKLKFGNLAGFQLEGPSQCSVLLGGTIVGV